MDILQRATGAWLALMLSLPAAAAPRELVFIAPTNHTMPLAQFQDGKLVAGIVKDLGEAIARRVGRTARFVETPSKRVSQALAQGRADGICYVLPNWIEGELDWSRAILPNSAVVAAHPAAPVIHALSELAGKPVGTVIGYRYAPLEAVLGAGFMRDDAPSMEHNLRKLAAGRRQYAIVEMASLEYLRRTDKSLHLRVDLEFISFKARCAFSRRAQVPFAELDRAIGALADDGSVEDILARYR